jgi:hypothetical protein
MRRKYGPAAWVAAALLGGAALAVAAEKDAPKAGIDAKAAFARLKTLKGTWQSAVSDEHKAAKKGEHSEKHTGKSTVIYRLTGAGSALVETQLPGSNIEMVSVYHLDRNDLRMTHYCAAGNQPHMKLDQARSTADHLIFVFDGGTNLDPAKDIHIHGLEITFDKDDQVTSAWEAYRGGKTMGTTSFVMKRQ